MKKSMKNELKARELFKGIDYEDLDDEKRDILQEDVYKYTLLIFCKYKWQVFVAISYLKQGAIPKKKI